MGPIFLLGSPRSGTTLLRLLLTAHPEIVIAPESSFLTWFLGDFGDWQVSDCASPRREKFVAELMDARKFSTWGISAAEIDKAIRETLPTNYAELVAIPYLRYCAKIGKPHARWGDKNNVHMDFVQPIAELFPDCVFLHIVRDVRDCFVSGQDIRIQGSDSPFMPKLATDPTEFARGWDEQNQDVIRQLNTFPPSRWARIRYEDLVVSPQRTLEPVLSEWGMEWSSAMLDFHEANRAQNLEPTETSEWKRLVSEPVTDTRIGRYQSVLSDADIAALDRAGHTTLEQFGYLDDRLDRHN
jgi:hypothetical protein